VTTFIVDVFPKLSASAAAALNLVRCLLAAEGTAAALPIVDGIGGLGRVGRSLCYGCYVFELGSGTAAAVAR
jgi:hypothetical protein